MAAERYTDQPTSKPEAPEELEMELKDSPTHSNDDDSERALLVVHDNSLELEDGLRQRARHRQRFGRLGGLTNCFRRRRRDSSDITDDGETPSKPVTAARVIRTIFNYPGPDFKPRKTGWLDALRGIAAFLVFIYHYADEWLEKDETWGPAPDNNPKAWWAMSILRIWYTAGGASVCFFLSISGYALTQRMIAQIRKRQHANVLQALSSAVMRRGIRLYFPVMVLSFTLMTLGHFFQFPMCAVWGPKETYLLEIWNWYQFCIKSWMPLRYPDRFYEILNYYDGTISWTIPLEYYGSIIVYIAILFTSRVTSFKVRAAIFTLFIYMYTTKDEWYVTQFLVGAIFAEYQLVQAERQAKIERNGGPYPPRWRGTLHKVLMVCLLLFGLHVYSMPGVRFKSGLDEHPRILYDRPTWDWIVAIPQFFNFYDTRQVDRFIMGFGGDCIMIAVGELTAIQRVLDARPFQYLGKLSFGLYLNHIWVRAFINPMSPFIIGLAGLDSSIPPWQQEPSWQYVLAYWIRVAISVPINFIVAGIFVRTLDKWSVDLGRWFENKANSIGRDVEEDEKAAEAAASSARPAQVEVEQRQRLLP